MHNAFMPVSEQMKYERAARLRLAREKARIKTAAEAAKRLRIERPTYYGHENGSRGFDAQEARFYAKAYKVRELWLLHGHAGGKAGIGVKD